MMPVLRPYQAAAIESGRDVLRTGKKRIAFYLATGGGKTICALAFVAGALAKGKRVAFIANRIHLVKQAAEKFHDAGIDYGVIQGQNSYNTSAPCIICSIQTVARRGLPPVDLIIIDEAHGVPGSKDYLKVIFGYNNVPVIGLTATPFSKGMAKPHRELLDEPLFESLVIATTIRELIEDGFLVDCEIYSPSEPDLSGVRTKRNQFGELDYDELQLAEAVDKPALIGDIVSHWKRMSGDRPTVCFATSIAHSQHIVAEFNRNGIPAGHLDGYMDDEERAEVLGRLERGEIKVLSNVAVLREGWDFPACAVLILARPTRSLIAWIQMAGRILRPAPGKDKALILDHSGSAHILGYPTDDLPLELCDGTPKKAQQKEREEPKPKKCPSCAFVKPPKVSKCPKCGFEPVRKPEEVEVIDGELRLVERISKKKADKYDKQDVYSQLLSIQRARGYSDGWTSHQYRKLFSVWPNGMQRICKEPTDEVKRWIKAQQIRHASSMAAKGEKRAA